MFFAYKDKANMADRGAIDVFLHLGSGDWSLDEFIDIYVVNKSVPKGYLPMAFDQFGDLICLVLEGVEAGRIKWCPTDQGLLVFGKDGYPEVGVTHEVADSLEEFLDSFVSEE